MNEKSGGANQVVSKNERGGKKLRKPEQTQSPNEWRW